MKRYTSIALMLIACGGLSSLYAATATSSENKHADESSLQAAGSAQAILSQAGAMADSFFQQAAQQLAILDAMEQLRADRAQIQAERAAKKKEEENKHAADAARQKSEKAAQARADRSKTCMGACRLYAEDAFTWAISGWKDGYLAQGSKFAWNNSSTKTKIIVLLALLAWCPLTSPYLLWIAKSLVSGIVHFGIEAFGVAFAALKGGNSEPIIQFLTACMQACKPGPEFANCVSLCSTQAEAMKAALAKALVPA